MAGIKARHLAEKDKVETLLSTAVCYRLRVHAHILQPREAVERTASLLTERGIENAFFHGGLEQIEREQTLTPFAMAACTSW